MAKAEAKSVLVQEIVLCLSRDEAVELEVALRKIKTPSVTQIAKQLDDAVRRLDLDADSY